MSRDAPRAWPPSDPEALRRAPRRLVSVAATVSSSADGRMACRVDNLSRLGCRIHLRCRLAPGTYLTLAIPAGATLGTRVAWSDGLRLGLEFLQPLHVAVLDNLLRLFRRSAVEGVRGPVPLLDWES